MTKDITLVCESAKIGTQNYHYITVDLDSVDIEDTLKQFTAREIAENIEIDEVLGELTADNVVENFKDDEDLLKCLLSRMNKEDVLAYFSTDELQKEIKERD